MNWKSYSVVSGAGLLATWLATSQPRVPGNVTPEQPREAAAAVAAASDIERQAERLQARLQNHARYREPARNLFRFSDRGPARVSAAPPAEASIAPLPEPAPVVPALPLKLTGIAMDGETRTAILSTPAGVVLAREGEDLLERFRVSKVEEDAVEIVTISDGVMTRLALRP
jgi:hypothetical protein